jgi:hypothetical protein
MSMLHYLANTGDVLDGMFQSLCMAMGFVIIPGTIIAWGWFFRRRRKNASGLAKGVAIVATALLIVWVLSVFLVRPPFPVAGSAAAYKVYNLPEVLAEGKEIGGSFEVAPNSKVPYWQFSFWKKSSEGRSIVWHRFRVDAYDGKVLVATDDEGEKWLSIEEWRAMMNDHREG